MAKEFGSKADMLSAKLDEVSRNSIWKEHCKKELHSTPADISFSVPNPRKISTLTEKPNICMPHVKVAEEEFHTATRDLHQLCSVKDSQLLPGEKFELPRTSAQEYGWATRPLVGRNTMFHYARHANDITKYADAYFSMTGTTAFSKKAEPGKK